MKTHENHQEVNRIAQETKALIAATAEATEERIVAARERLSSAMEAAGETYERVKTKAIQGAKATDKAIRGNPYKSLAVAFGVGALIGYVWSRRSRD